MSTVALRRSLILRACESFDFRSKSHHIWGESLEFCTTSWGSGGMTAKDSQALRRPPTGPRVARPEDRLRGRLEGRTVVVQQIINSFTRSFAGTTNASVRTVVIH